MPRNSIALALLLAAPAAVQSAPASPPAAASPRPFELGTITVSGTRQPGIDISGSSLSAEAILAFERLTLDEALKLVPGATASNSGGSRNERLIFVRGFDRLQVPLSIDGIRVYLPADNRLDFGRFVTGDIAEVQVAKGHVSVLDGPGAMGGAVNLVTRTPGDRLDLEGRAGLSLDRRGDLSGHDLFGYAGTRLGRWHAQVSGARNDRDFFTLAKGFTPTPNQAAGRRDFSDARDWRVNARIGFAPIEGGEIAVSYTRQEGSKNAPLETTFPLPVQRFWAWPEWNVETIALFAALPLGDSARLRAQAYRSRFDNLLRAFDSRSQTTQTLPRAFNSWYEDEAVGGFVRFDADLAPHHALGLALHVREDEHVEYQQVFPSRVIEPPQTSRETTWSAAGEWRFAVSPVLFLAVGGSFDWRDLHRAEDYGTPPGGGPARVFAYPTANGQAWNAQGKLDWRPDPASRVALAVSSRARFPTLFERFSSRFGGATSNPDLGAERATQVELSGAREAARWRAEGALFVADVRDAIFSVPALFYPCTASTVPPPVPTLGCEPQPVSQSRNVGRGSYWGAEGALSAELTSRLRTGASLTFVKRDIADPNNPAWRPTGVPDISAFLWAEWEPLPALFLLPSLELAGDRWLVNTAGNRWIRDGSHALLNLRLAWRPRPGLEVAAAANNLADANYQLAFGFPEQGRNVRLSVRAVY
ncbi:TonB-dependent receptor plug domain-containing protein [Thermaurantiacus tibetensis]|uniref:TonB-dependent receptor plug domain-containing protein n=1 Tax=Thermaurantiacus tibetensis TaxID=2759035 RepID=UPI00188EEC67|nr:TonB-dependent receptor [Thermaurantiacus tibetensis]